MLKLKKKKENCTLLGLEPVFYTLITWPSFLTTTITVKCDNIYIKILKEDKKNFSETARIRTCRRKKKVRGQGKTLQLLLNVKANNDQKLKKKKWKYTQHGFEPVTLQRHSFLLQCYNHLATLPSYRRKLIVGLHYSIRIYWFC